MGTSYNLHCLDCRETAKVAANFDPVRLAYIQPIVQHAEAISKLGPLFAEDSSWGLECAGVYVPVPWLAKHAGHRIRAISEYGGVENTCAKSVPCSGCGVPRGYCAKDVGHDGTCEAAT